MKALAMFLAAALLVLAVGCQENAVEPIVAQAPAKSVPVLQKLEISERLEINTPDGLTGSVDIVGQITYQLVQVDQASLKKELPIVTKKVYSLMLNGKGEMAPAGDLQANGLAKPNTWAFSGSLNAVVEEGGEFFAAFRIEGTKYPLAHYHVGFSLAGGKLARTMRYVDFHEKGIE